MSDGGYFYLAAIQGAFHILLVCKNKKTHTM